MEKVEKLSIDLGNCETVKKSHNAIIEAIDSLKSHIKDPEMVIYEYFLKIRTKIDLDREKMNEHYLGLIDELSLIEEKCKKNGLKDEKVYSEVIKEAEKNLEEFESEMLEEFEIDTYSWHELKLKFDQQITMINHKISDFENELFLNKSYTYQSANFDEKTMNAKILCDVVKRNDFDKFVSFHFTLDEFKEITETKDSIFYSKNHLFNGIIWYAALKNIDGENLSCGICCNLGFIYKMVKIKVKIQLNNVKGPEQNKIGSFEHTFDSIFGIGSSGFISFEDIFNKGFYTKEEDSIHFSIFIEIIDLIYVSECFSVLRNFRF